MNAQEKVDAIASFLGEGFHTAFRRAADSPEASKIHDLIAEMDDDEWGAVLDFVARPLIEAWSGLTS